MQSYIVGLPTHGVYPDGNSWWWNFIWKLSFDPSRREGMGGGCKNRLPADKKQKINEQSLISTPNKIEGENIPRSSLFIHKKVAGIFEFWSFTSTRSVPHTAASGCFMCLLFTTTTKGKKIQFEKWKILIACSWVGGCEIYDAPRERESKPQRGWRRIYWRGGSTGRSCAIIFEVQVESDRHRRNRNNERLLFIVMCQWRLAHPAHLKLIVWFNGSTMVNESSRKIKFSH